MTFDNIHFVSVIRIIDFGSVTNISLEKSVIVIPSADNTILQNVR